jgi:hypothetical protein
MKITEKPGAFKNIKALGGDVMGAIDDKLSMGEPASAIADWLKKEQGFLPEMRRDNLIRTLDRYRSTELRNRLLARMTEAQHHDSTKTIMKRLNALNEMEEVVTIQRARLDKVLMLETDKPMIIKVVSDEIKLLKDMLMNLGNLQLETGYLHRAPKTIKGIMAMKDGNEQAFSWTEEQAKLFKEVEDLEAKLGDG